MLIYITRRVLYSIPVLLASTFLCFLFISYPSDPLGQIHLIPRVSQQTIANLTHQYQLDKPIPLRYFYWLESVFTDKFGKSLITLQPVWPDITRTLGHTMQVVLVSQLIALFLGVIVGIYSAIRQYSVFDYSFTTFSFLGLATPVFWLALLLQIAFTDIYTQWHVRIFYTSGLNSTAGGSAWSLDRFQHIALPVITLTVISFALYSRFMRAAMLDVLNADYVRTARAKGLPEWRVISGHVFRNALIPITTVAALNIGAVFGGAIITEQVFTLDGIGFYFLNRLNAGDIYAVMAYLTVTAVIILVFNLIADVAYGFLDPRIRYD